MNECSRPSICPINPNDLLNQSHNDQLHEFDFNRNPSTCECRLAVLKALLFCAWDQSDKAHPCIKIFLSNDLIVDDVVAQS